MKQSDQKTLKFESRHIGITNDDVTTMLGQINDGKYKTIDELVDAAIPKSIRTSKAMGLDKALSESDALRKMKEVASRNTSHRSLIGLGYYGTLVPPVIQRNILENPGWYTQYTPYQAEISQGRLEALINFQTMVADLTKLPLANASLLDESTAAAEAMTLAWNARAKNTANLFFVDERCFPQTISVVQTRAEPLGIEIVVGNPENIDFSAAPFGVLLQYPGKEGDVCDYGSLVAEAKRNGSIVAVAADLMALTMLKPPGEFGADIAIGSCQRFGVPMGYGGPHAAYFATLEEHKRRIPGRIIGVSKDSTGKLAYRMALQTREQHIRRDKATSNICTSQVLLAIMSGMYGVYHGPDNLKAIGESIHNNACQFAEKAAANGYKVRHDSFFDTVCLETTDAQKKTLLAAATKAGFNFNSHLANVVTISIDETLNEQDMSALFKVLDDNKIGSGASTPAVPGKLRRKSVFMEHEVFNSYRSESQLLRYIKRLESKDLSLTRSMIPLGSCTMKLNAVSELYPVSWPEFGNPHPFAPADQVQGYHQLVNDLSDSLAKCTGFDAVSLQPNSGAQGEYAGLLVIRKFHQANNNSHRNICLIPKSAHGTNPASAVMAGMKVVVVECDKDGNIDLDDLGKKADTNAENLAALMVTYPSTHGVFEEEITKICDLIHKHGGQVYMDGANLNAQIGLCKPGEYGPDVCHLNLHKTFCIPHGGGGPGMGPIAVKSHLANFLPSHPVVNTGTDQSMGPVSAAPFGSAGILPISMMYIWMMGDDGLTNATKAAILNANYLAARLESLFPVLYRGRSDLVAHECIIDIRPTKQETGIDVEDIAKRLMDFGFHAPTMSFPVAGTLMIEPTESEDLAELDRFFDTMKKIKAEIEDVKNGKYSKEDNPLHNAPHTIEDLVEESWQHSYSRQEAVFPLEWIAGNKFWPSVKRIDAAFGDRNLICACPDLSSYES